MFAKSGSEFINAVMSLRIAIIIKNNKVLLDIALRLLRGLNMRTILSDFKLRVPADISIIL